MTALAGSRLESAANRLRELSGDLMQLSEDLIRPGHPPSEQHKRAIVEMRCKVHCILVDVLRASEGGAE